MSEKKKEKGYMHGGLRQKYIIQKVSGKPVDPKAKYFVLRYDEDPHALIALKAYALSVKADNPQLSDDILEEIKAGRR